MGLRDTIAQREAQPGSLAGRLGGEEWCEEPGPVLVTHAVAGVADHQKGSWALGASLDRDPPYPSIRKVGQRLDRIGEQVEQDLLEFVRISVHRHGVTGEPA